MSVHLEWEGKPKHVERLSLPFQTVETINESRATRERDTGSLPLGGATGSSARNLLIWGDNKLVMSSLLSEYAGRLKLIYIDPPFATGDDFSVQVSVGGDGLVKAPSILEEHAYRDTWGRGYESYLSMMYERLVLIHDLLSEDGALYVHAGTTVSHLLRALCDEIFGSENFRTGYPARSTDHNILWSPLLGVEGAVGRRLGRHGLLEEAVEEQPAAAG